MKEIKTLKDFDNKIGLQHWEEGFLSPEELKKQLKAEAVKWIKKCEEEYEHLHIPIFNYEKLENGMISGNIITNMTQLEQHKRISQIKGKYEFIKHFFNISESDLE
jgi:hypothetical protein